MHQNLRTVELDYVVIHSGRIHHTKLPNFHCPHLMCCHPLALVAHVNFSLVTTPLHDYNSCLTPLVLQEICTSSAFFPQTIVLLSSPELSL